MNRINGFGFSPFNQELYASLIRPKRTRQFSWIGDGDTNGGGIEGNSGSEKPKLGYSHLVVSFKKTSDVAVFELADKNFSYLTGIDYNDLRDGIRRSAVGTKKIILNFQNVKFVDSECLGKLITFRGKLKQEGIELRFCSMKDYIFERFKISNVVDLLAIYRTEEDAIRDKNRVRQ